MRSSHVGRIGQRSKKFAQGLCLCEEVVRQLLHSLVMWRWFCSALKLSDTVQQQERQFPLRPDPPQIALQSAAFS
jgi:hypothetical protein